jgi:hypothetical protein
MLSYGSKSWTSTKEEMVTTEMADMCFLRALIENRTMAQICNK